MEILSTLKEEVDEMHANHSARMDSIDNKI
jgi:hypothetical protein